MPFIPGPGEPVFPAYQAVPFHEWLTALIDVAGYPIVRPRILAVDGRSGSGKSTLASRIVDALPGTTVVHTDDLAWNHAVLDWDELLLTRILNPLHRGQRVEFQPPAWIRHGRSGTIAVPARQTTVVIEGTGSIRDTTANLYDASVWIQSDFDATRARGIERDVATGVNGDRTAAAAFWDRWQQEEVPLLAAQQPWTRATTIVTGTDVIPLRGDELAVAKHPTPRP